MKKTLSALMLVYCQFTFGQTSFSSKKNFNINTDDAISIEFRVDTKEFTDTTMTTVYFSPVETIDIREWTTEKQRAENGTTKWVIRTLEPNFFRTPSLYKNKEYSTKFLAEPGDKVIITSNGEHLQFSGKGAEKFKLQYQIDSILVNIAPPKNPRDYMTVSLEDFMEWRDFLNRKLELILPMIESSKNKLSSYAYNFIKASVVDQYIDDWSDKFATFRSYARKNGISNQRLCEIYDSTYYVSAVKWFPYAAAHVYGSYRPLEKQILRKYSFDNSKDPLNSELKFKSLAYEAGLTIYKGLIREKFITEYLFKELIQEVGFTPETENMLARYYAEPGYPEYKKYLRKMELKERERLNEKKAPDFALTDLNGKPFTKENIKGKIAVFDFWFTGCAGCVTMVPVMKNIENEFKDDPDIVFISVSVDKSKDQWLKSIAQKKYTTGGGINLYTGGESVNHPMIREYAIDGYPTIYLMDAHGRFIRTYPKPDPRRDNGKSLSELLQKQLSYLKDGPYILHESNVSTAYSIAGEKLATNRIDNSNAAPLRVQTDYNKTFSVPLKKSLSIEPSEYPRPEKLLALSDIEGNFEAFRKLLQANKVMDNDFNWTFGKGHLVFAGDMFDRGQQVTECLWLIYSLEEKAREAGGYVHFILGNHEIMNLQGNHKYAQAKYKNNASLIGKSLKELYDSNSELGRWLRTKNIMEKIEDIIFVHGGIAKEFSDSVSLSIEGINNYFRQNLDTDNPGKSEDRNIRFIFSNIAESGFSPFWFRRYYGDADKHYQFAKDPSVKVTIEKPDEKEMNDILKKWKVSRIITGHTIVADTISIHYGGKVINIDTKHSGGKSEALLIEGDKYYRVNNSGQRVALLLSPPENEAALQRKN